jgi:3-deoxy-D-manno-octulosonic-acid transferase
MKKEFPLKKITLSTTTYTGQTIARDTFPEADRIMYMPIDALPGIARAVNALRPEFFITVETEIWPLLFTRLKKAGTKIIILNGRISDSSFQGYRRIQFFMKNVLSHVDFLYMQSQADADRITALGADTGRVGVMGNFKFDFEPNSPETPQWLDKVKGRIFLAGSTHKGEETIIVDAFQKIRNEFSDVQLILAPRHPERFPDAEAVLKEKGVDYIKRTSIVDHNDIHCQAILLDTMGELSNVYARSEVSFIGGSLVPVGGHNIMEPAYWSRPVLFGPHMNNFPVASEFIKKGAAIQVSNKDDLVQSVKSLLNNPEEASRMGQKARELVEHNSGAADRAIELLRRYLGTP